MRNHATKRLVDTTQYEAVEMLSSVIEPLLGLMFDAGVTVPQINKAIRERAVSTAMKSVVKASGRASKSRVALITGLPRSEVARILNARATERGSDNRKPLVKRVISAWSEDPMFLTKSGLPAVLPIFGGRISFQSLVEKHGGGMPVRAMLDELSQKELVVLLKHQRTKVKSLAPKITEIGPQAIKAMGNRGRGLMETLVYNVRNPSSPHFEAATSVVLGDLESASIAKRKIADQGRAFIDQASKTLKLHSKNSAVRAGDKSSRYRAGVAIFYFQAEVVSASTRVLAKPIPRKNLQRNTRISKLP